jgi:hypothetical protein
MLTKTGRPYAKRRLSSVVVQLDLDQEAADLLHHYSTAKTLGRFVARLLYEHRARQEGRDEERARLQQADQQDLVAGGAAESRASKAG